MKWGFLFEDGSDLRAMRSRHTSDRLEKTAGVFMRPSDIGDHTELAASLEGLLNGQPGETAFKDHPGESKTAGASDLAIGAALGGTGGFYAVRRSQANPVPPPENTQGVGNKLQDMRHRASEYAGRNPKTSLAVGTLVGAIAGGQATHKSDIVRRIRELDRKS